MAKMRWRDRGGGLTALPVRPPIVGLKRMGGRKRRKRNDRSESVGWVKGGEVKGGCTPPPA